MITISREDLRVQLCRPGEYYQGTRFDHAGVFRCIEKGGFVFADEWFSHADPFRHDRVCGPSEEFVTVDFDGVAPGGVFCKVGVGLLRRPDDAPYDWFRLYEVADPGVWDVQEADDQVLYRHTLKGWYTYEKTVRLSGPSNLQIAHWLRWEAPSALKGFHYNHHFFTFGGAPVGPSRQISFPFRPSGHWRDTYDNVALEGHGIAFSAPITKTPCVYMGDLHNDRGLTPCFFSVREGEHQVYVLGNRTVHHMVFWANPQVACIEPYMPLELAKGQKLDWMLDYSFMP